MSSKNRLAYDKFMREFAEHLHSFRSSPHVGSLTLDVLPRADRDEELIARKILAERARIFIDRAVGGAFSSFLGTLLLAWIQAPVSGNPRALAWLCCIYVVEFLIIAFGYQFRRAHAADEDAPKWVWPHIWASMLVGLAWGSSVWFFWTEGQFFYYLVNVSVIVAVTALTLTIVAPFTTATILFTGGILIPVIIHSATVENPLAMQISIGLVVLFFVQMHFARIQKQQVINGLDTAVRNQFLAERLRVSERQMLIAQQISATGTWSYDITTRRIRASAEGLLIFGYQSIARDVPLEDIESRISERERVHQALIELIQDGKDYDVEYTVHPADGSKDRRVRSIARLEKNETDGSAYVLGFIQDITKSKDLEDRVKELAFYDSLTKLANRHLLSDRLQQAIQTNRRNACYGALIFLDLDNFKPLNDRYGHATGDLLLVEVARRLTNCVRAVDTVARFGGDEFVVVLTELDVSSSAAHLHARFVAEKIRSSLELPFELNTSNDGQSSNTIVHKCSASLGVVVFGNHDSQPDDLLKWADAAMYRAKDEGRNAICFHA